MFGNILDAATWKKYKDFLSEKFKPNENFIISTDVNRTIVSAMAYLQGIYIKFYYSNFNWITNK